jgi:hypothetical protein
VAFLDSRSEAYFKSGLAKSAFRDTIYDGLPVDYYLPFITSTQRTFFAMRERFYPKFYQAHDSFMMYYKPYSTVLTSLKKQNKAAPLWRLIVEKAIKSDKFYDINKITNGSSELSIVAAVKFLQNLLREIDVESVQQRQKQLFQQQPQQQTLTGQTVQQALQALEESVEEALDHAIEETLEAVAEYKESMDTVSEAIISLVGSGGHGFSKEALSVLRFLQNPDEFRKRVRLLRFARVFYSRFLTAVPTSMIHQQLVSVYGGINGVTRMFSEKQLTDILPSELVLAHLGEAGKALLALKILQKQLTVYQRAASVKPVIFVDKSGSMAEELEYSKRDREIHESAPKISLATGLALACTESSTLMSTV